MRPFVLQDWITVRSTGKPPPPYGPNFVQDVAGWLDLSAFQDVVFWLHLGQVAALSRCTLTWCFQTAPTKDETLFQTMISTQTAYTTIASPIITVLPVTLTGAIAGGTTPLSTWVRWMIQVGGVDVTPENLARA